MMQKSFWFLLLLVVFIGVFSVQNAGVVAIEFAVWRGEVSLSILLILTFLLGLVTGVVYAMVARKRKNKIRKDDQVGDVPFEVNVAPGEDDGLEEECHS